MAGYQKGKLPTEAGRPETIKQQSAGAVATLYCY